jgi:methylated-DNA-[protein]-cysteine S-methyltransferase
MNATMTSTTTLYTQIPSPLGELLLTGDGERLHALHMQEGKLAPIAAQPEWEHAPDAFADLAAQLDEYFLGERVAFDAELQPRGTAFQQRVWEELRRIPYGETISYGELARRVGQPSASRAVGMANGRNPIAVIIPCHRVIGADGSLTGFGGGLSNKRLLLDLEASRARPRMM